MPPEPIFGPNDRVDNTSQLPAELRGETDPVKIAQYYQRREAGLREELRNTSKSQPVTLETPIPAPETPPVSATDNLPTNATFTAEEATAARETLINAARQTAKIGKKYWDRLNTDIEKLMATMPMENRVNSSVWETCYNTLVGRNIDRLIQEDQDAAAKASQSASEHSSLAPEAPATPAPLPTEVTSRILPGLGITESQYRTAQDHISKGRWPLTSDNSGGRRSTIGE